MDFISIGLTLLLGVLGTLWKEPPRGAKAALVVLLVVSSAASVFKSLGNERDKELLQTLAIAGLALPNTAYDKVYRALDTALGPDADARCPARLRPGHLPAFLRGLP